MHIGFALEPNFGILDDATIVMMLKSGPFGFLRLPSDARLRRKLGLLPYDLSSFLRKLS